jgi:hypothetical protein
MTDPQTPDLFAPPPVPPSQTQRPGFCFLCWGLPCPHPEQCGVFAEHTEYPK